jgi:HlyD family secretion protein
MILRNLLLAAVLATLIMACGEIDKSDAYGNFEATSITVSANGNGQLIYLNVDEGQRLSANQLIGLIDTTQLHLEKLKLQAQLRSLEEKLRDAGPEIAVLKERLVNLTRERNRTQQHKSNWMILMAKWMSSTVKSIQLKRKSLSRIVGSYRNVSR